MLLDEMCVIPDEKKHPV